MKRYHLSSSFLGVVLSAKIAFSQRSWPYLAAGAVLLRLRKEIPRHQFEVPLQAAVGSRVIARETIKAYRKDIIKGMSGGDVTRKQKLLNKQKKGKKRMKMIGNVEIPQKAFMAVLEGGGE